MGNMIGASIRWGAFFGTIAAFTTALILTCYWCLNGSPNLLIMGMVFWVPPMTLLGGIAATVVFGLVGTIMSFRPVGLEPSPIGYAIFGSILTYGLVILPFSSWVAGGLYRALQGAQGTDWLRPAVLLPVAIAGLLTGGKVRAER
jgi:hypothetical protein